MDGEIHYSLWDDGSISDWYDEVCDISGFASEPDVESFSPICVDPSTRLRGRQLQAILLGVVLGSCLESAGTALAVDLAEAAIDYETETYYGTIAGESISFLKASSDFLQLAQKVAGPAVGVGALCGIATDAAMACFGTQVYVGICGSVSNNWPW